MMTETIHHHFSKIAPRYRALRVTDLEPIVFMEDKLREHTRIVAADIGCGAGRYDAKLLQRLGRRLFLYCVDTNRDMLKTLKEFLAGEKTRNFQTVRATAEKVPLRDDSLDCIFTFNAIHHFRISQFLNEASRLLRNNGYLFVYTRFRSQNRRNIWGRYFPLFHEKETRLPEVNELKGPIRKLRALRIEAVEYFKYARLSSLDALLERTRNHHYSTFHLYTEKEFDDSLKKFEQNIRSNFKDRNEIKWFDENALLVIRRQID